MITLAAGLLGMLIIVRTMKVKYLVIGLAGLTALVAVLMLVAPHVEITIK